MPTFGGIRKPINSSTKPPVASSYGLYFESISLNEEQAKNIIKNIKKLSEPLAKQHMVVWSRSDENYFEVLKAFGIADLPAFVFTKPWVGRDVGATWDWTGDPYMIDKIRNAGEMPVHCTIQGDEVFSDIPKMTNTLEKLSILFGSATDEQLEHAIRKSKMTELAESIFQRSKNFLKDVAVTFSVGIFSIKVNYDKDGAEVSVEEKTSKDKEK